MFIRVYFSLRSVVFFVSFGCRTQQMITGIQVWAGRLQTFPWNWKLGDIQAVKTAFPVEWHFAFTAGWCINFKWYRLHLTAKKSRCFEPSFDGYISSIFWEMPNGVAGPYTFWSQSRSPQCDMMRWKAKRMKAQRTSSLTFGILESTQRWQAVPRVVEDPITTSYFFRKKNIYIYIRWCIHTGIRRYTSTSTWYDQFPTQCLLGGQDFVHQFPWLDELSGLAFFIFPQLFLKQSHQCVVSWQMIPMIPKRDFYRKAKGPRYIHLFWMSKPSTEPISVPFFRLRKSQINYCLLPMLRPVCII